MIIVTLLIALALAFVAAVFAIQNPIPVELKFFTMTFSGGLTLFIIIAFAAGILSGFLLVLPGSIKTRAQLALARRKLDNIAKTVEKSQQAAAPEPKEKSKEKELVH
jgi:uncharacterized integral membrane protein